jgi:hypothetical protein
MSYSTSYISFNESSADRKWSNFDDILSDDIIAKRKRIKELEDKYLYTSESNIEPELIYNPKHKEEYEKKRAEIIENKEKWKSELDELKNENFPYNSRIFNYIDSQKPIESEGEIIIEMIKLDLELGGHSVDFWSGECYLGRAENTLRIIFPELESDFDDSLSRNDIVFIGNHIEEINTRFSQSKKTLLEEIDMENQDDEGIEYLKEEVKDFLMAMLPVIRDVVKNNASFFCSGDHEPYPEDENLEIRVLKHIKQFKNHPLMKVPLQNYIK